SFLMVGRLTTMCGRGERREDAADHGNLARPRNQPPATAVSDGWRRRRRWCGPGGYQVPAPTTVWRGRCLAWSERLRALREPCAVAEEEIARPGLAGGPGANGGSRAGRVAVDGWLGGAPLRVLRGLPDQLVLGPEAARGHREARRHLAQRPGSGGSAGPGRGL